MDAIKHTLSKLWWPAPVETGAPKPKSSDTTSGRVDAARDSAFASSAQGRQSPPGDPFSPAAGGTWYTVDRSDLRKTPSPVDLRRTPTPIPGTSRVASPSLPTTVIGSTSIPHTPETEEAGTSTFDGVLQLITTDPCEHQAPMVSPAPGSPRASLPSIQESVVAATTNNGGGLIPAPIEPRVSSPTTTAGSTHGCEDETDVMPDEPDFTLASADSSAPSATTSSHLVKPGESTPKADALASSEHTPTASVTIDDTTSYPSSRRGADDRQPEIAGSQMPPRYFKCFNRDMFDS